MRSFALRRGLRAAIVSFILTELLQGEFIVFVMYEAAVMAIALAIYSFLAVANRLKGAWIVSLAILINLAAAAVQASGISARIIFPFDHNGIFHLVQMVGIGTLWLGLRLGCNPCGSAPVAKGHGIL